MKTPRSAQSFLSIPEQRRFRNKLLAWYEAHRRDLPWRLNRDPYRVWLSEIMLQQTRVAAVIEHYQEFLRRFPTVEKLAAAREVRMPSSPGIAQRLEILRERSNRYGWYRRARRGIIGCGKSTMSSQIAVGLKSLLAVTPA